LGGGDAQGRDRFDGAVGRTKEERKEDPRDNEIVRAAVANEPSGSVKFVDLFCKG
jgi:hypothetical protein